MSRTKIFNDPVDRRRQRYKEKNLKLFQEYRSACRCIMCGASTEIQFHHVEPHKKEINVGSMPGRGFSWKHILKELKKCVPLCKTCHDGVHAGTVTLLPEGSTSEQIPAVV